MENWEQLQADENKIIGVHFTPGRGGAEINKVILHHNGGNLSIQDCFNVWQSREASAQYQVDVNGRIGQLVNDWDTSWNSGDWDANTTSIAIEHADVSNSPWRISDATLENGAHLTAAICKYYGLGRPTWMVNVFPHSHFTSTACPASIEGSQRDQYIARAQAWYDAMQSGKAPEVATPSAPAPAPVAKPAGPVTTATVRYALRDLNGPWNNEVTNFGGGEDGFAGTPNGQHDLFYVNVDHGSLKYRAHILGGDWEDWVTKGDRNDTVNGCAGIPGRAIDGVQLYYTTPNGEGFQQAYYRSQTTARSGWLDVACDDGNSVDGFDDFAGMLGEPMDRLQIKIAPSNPF